MKANIDIDSERSFSRYLLSFAGLVSLILVSWTLVRAQPASQIIVGPNVQVSRDEGFKVAEFHIASDPTNPKNLIAAGMLDPFQRSEGREGCRAYLSRDGGYTWRTLTMPGVPYFQGDPQVAYGRTGTAFFLCMGRDPNLKGTDPNDLTSLVIYRSEDGGTTWQNPVYGPRPQIDHPQIAVDRSNGSTAGNLYISGNVPIHRGRHSGMARDVHILVYVSKDDGRTWKLTDAAGNENSIGLSFNSSPSPLVLSSGELFVPFYMHGPGTRFQSWEEYTKFQSENMPGKDGSFGFMSPAFVRSMDGGQTFSSLKRMVTRKGEAISVAFDSFYALDRSSGPFKDRIYAVWMERHYRSGNSDFADVRGRWRSRLLMSYSSDGGKTWEDPRPLTSNKPFGHEFFPSIAVNSEGTLGIAWYDTRDSPARDPSEGMKGEIVNQYFTASSDGGVSFLPAVKVSSVPTEPLALESRLIFPFFGGLDLVFMNGKGGYGDYTAMATTNDGSFHPVWSDGRTGSSQMWTSVIRVDRRATVTPELVEADVSGDIVGDFGSLLKGAPAGTVELEVRLKNTSKKTIYGPLKVEVSAVTTRPRGAGDAILGPVILNAPNGTDNVGAAFDYSTKLGSHLRLEPGAISEGIVWRIKQPEKFSPIPRLRLKIAGRVERSNAAAEPGKSVPKKQ